MWFEKGLTMNVVGVGTQIVECLRIAQMIERHDELFIRRVFTPREIAFCSSRTRTAQHYAATWAGKMAVMRALDVRIDSLQAWRDIEIRYQSNVSTVVLTGHLSAECTRRQIGQLHLSVAHCRSHATGYALAIERDS